MEREIDTTNFGASAGLFASVQKILEELRMEIHVSLSHTSLKFKLSGTIHA